MVDMVCFQVVSVCMNLCRFRFSVVAHLPRVRAFPVGYFLVSALTVAPGNLNFELKSQVTFSLMKLN